LGCLLESGRDAPELFEPAEAAIDEVTIGVEVAIERVLLGAGGIAGDDRLGAERRDSFADVIGNVGSAMTTSAERPR
jgi:hypothetical protein